MTQKQENERLARVEEKTDNIEKKVDSIDAKLDNLIPELDKRYAPKWVANAITIAISVVMTAFLGALTAYVIVKPTPITTTVTPTETKVQTQSN